MTYRKGHLVVRGWAYDLNGVFPPIVLKDRSRILPMTEQHYPRPDVNESLELADDTCSGYVIKTPLSEIKHDRIAIEFVNEFGYVAREIKIILDEKKREAYLAENAEPNCPARGRTISRMNRRSVSRYRFTIQEKSS